MKLNYGITFQDLKVCKLKRDKQLNYLKSNFYINFAGERKSLLDISMAANFSSNYYAEVANRTNTINSLMHCNGLVPVFLTITLNGCFRGALNGDFSSFTKQDIKSLPYEQVYKLNRGINFEIRDLINIINYNFHKFNKRFRAKFKDDVFNYIRTFEPHKKDGVPHLHALIYIPKHSLDYMLNIYKDIFYAPQNLRKNQLSISQIKNGEINGFQWSLTNATGYVMKYITKTFINFNEEDDLNELQAWYIKHKVRRFLTSRTPIPLWVYRKINFITGLQDFRGLSILKDFENSLIEWDYESDYIFISIPHTSQELIYENGHLLYYVCGVLVNEYHKEKPIYKNIDTTIDWQSIKQNRKNIKLEKLKAINQKRRNLELYYSGELNPKEMSITNMTDWTLTNYYLAYDHSDENVQRLAILENELYKRGFSNLTKNNSLLDLNNVDELYDHFIDKEMKYLEF